MLLNLRLIGAGMPEASPSAVNRNLRLWINAGMVGILVTGLLIGTAGAMRLYNSPAFTVKMLALLAGIIFTYGVSGPVAKADGAVGTGPRAWWLAGMAVLLLGVFVFATSKGINPGMFHVLTATALIVLFVTPGRVRWIFLAGLLLLLAAQTVGTHFVVKQDDFVRLDPTNKAFAAAFAVWILGFAAYQLFGVKGGPESRPLTRAIGYTSILVWIVAAAAGRWIPFG
jgi:hypothetical protein